MLLTDKISSLTAQNAVSEMHKLVDNARVSISWAGKRVVYVQGYQDSAEIDQLALKYLKANAFNLRNEKLKDHALLKRVENLRERLDCYNLWQRIRQLYEASEKELHKSCLYYNFVSTLEYFSTPHILKKSVLSNILDQRQQHSLFEFDPDEFKSLFKGQNAAWIIPRGHYDVSERWVATKEMVEAVLHKTNKNEEKS